jgi:hypothetical protein
VITAASCIVNFNPTYGVPFSAENVEILLGKMYFVLLIQVKKSK